MMDSNYFKKEEFAMNKKWSKPVIDTVTKDELEDLVTAAGCSRYYECQIY